ncbi:MAG: DUF1638 domain-containing protein [Bacillota bacterium]
MRIKIIACETIKGEIIEASRTGPAASSGTPDRPSLDVSYTFLEHGLHRTPGLMKDRIQEHIDSTSDSDLVILGYGLCSNGVLGVRARRCPIVMPRVDDCIALFLGSREAYRREFTREPGTYYLTPGWINCGSDPLKTYHEYSKKYDRETALWITREMMKNYTRVAYIETGASEERVKTWAPGTGISQAAREPIGNGGRVTDGDYRAYARDVAAFLGVRYEEIEGSLGFLKRLLGCSQGVVCKWDAWDKGCDLGDTWSRDEDLVLILPGEELTMERMSIGGNSAVGLP